MRYLALLIVAAVLTGCPHNPQPPKPPRPQPGPTPVVTDTDRCQDAHNNLVALQCKRSDGEPMWMNADGEPFSETCRRLQEKGGIFVDPICIAESTSCQEANACPPSSL